MIKITRVLLGLFLASLIGMSGCGGGRDTASDTTNNDPPSAVSKIPTLISPRNGSYINSMRPHFIWSPVPGATYYRLYYDGMNNLDEVTYPAGAITIDGNCEVFDIAIAEGGVVWKVQAYVDGSWQPYSINGYFEIHLM